MINLVNKTTTQKLIYFCNLLCLRRLSRRLFWSIEAMFHERDSHERHHATAKAAETSPFELYHFLQAFLQAAPQIILQFYIILREDVFRNYETSEFVLFTVCFKNIIYFVFMHMLRCRAFVLCSFLLLFLASNAACILWELKPTTY